MPPRAAAVDPYRDWIDLVLRADLDAPRKQRHTAKRIFERLVVELDAHELHYDMVRRYVGPRREQIAVEAGRAPVAGFVTQSHAPGQEAEVDFADVFVRLRGVETRCYLFTLRLSYSGRAVHRVFASAGLEAFEEGHVHAFEVLGGVPRGQIRFDNLKAAVVKVLEHTRARVENARWLAFRSFYGFDAFYCLPGKGGAHEKGGVEGEGGFFRRNRLVPVPEADSLAQLNERIDGWDREQLGRRIGARLHTIGEMFQVEAPLLAPLPGEAWESGTLLTPVVDRYATIRVRTVTYSVPVHLIGRRVRVQLHANDLQIYDQGRCVARHERCGTKAGQVLELDHYLELLVRKPGALAGSSVLQQARAAGTFTDIHQAWWDAACARHGRSAGTRALIEVLLLHRHMDPGQVAGGMAATLPVGALSADSVALEARRRVERADAGADTALAEKLARLPADTRPDPDVTRYDQLLHPHAPTKPPTISKERSA